MADERIFWDIEQVKPWDKNPKIIKDKNFDNLKRTLEEEGQDLPLIIDTRKGNEGVIISGNMRYAAMKELGWKKVWVYLKETKDDAHLFKLAVQHNMNYGEYVAEQVSELAELYKDELHLEDLDIHLAQPVDLEFHLQNFGEEQAESPDVDTTDDKLDVFLNNQIKQIVLYFEGKQYDEIIERLDHIAGAKGLSNNTEIFLELLNFYESEHKED